MLVRHSIHETGHHWGLSEGLTEMLTSKYFNRDMSINGGVARLDDLMYSPFYDNLLAKETGDRKTWSFLRSPNANEEYGKLWDENMTVTVNEQTSPLVEYSSFQVARSLSQADLYRGIGERSGEIASGYEKFAGINNVRDEFVKMASIFEKALKTNDSTAIKQVRDFIKSIVDYREILKNDEDEIKYLLMQPQRSFIDEWVKAHNDAIKNPKTQTQQTAPIKVNLGQEVGCCK
jgi:hypothetical protein